MYSIEPCSDLTIWNSGPRRWLGPFMITTRNWILPYLPTFEAHEKELLVRGVQIVCSNSLFLDKLVVCPYQILASVVKQGDMIYYSPSVWLVQAASREGRLSLGVTAIFPRGRCVPEVKYSHTEPLPLKVLKYLNHHQMYST